MGHKENVVADSKDRISSATNGVLSLSQRYLYSDIGHATLAQDPFARCDLSAKILLASYCSKAAVAKVCLYVIFHGPHCWRKGRLCISLGELITKVKTADGREDHYGNLIVPHALKRRRSAINNTVTETAMNVAIRNYKSGRYVRYDDSYT